MVAGFAATVAIPATQALLDAGGWRWSLRVLATVLATCVVMQLGVVRSTPTPADPARREEWPRPRPSAESRPARTALAPGPGAEVAWLTLAAAAAPAAVSIVTVHLVAYLTGRGTAPLTAALAAGSLGIMSVTGRILFTAAAVRLGVARTSATMVALQAAGVAALVWATGTVGLVTFVVLFGAGFGFMTIARPTLLGEDVPATIFGRVSGRQTLAMNLARATAPWLTALSVQATGSYALLFAAVTALVPAAAAALTAGAVIARL